MRKIQTLLFAAAAFSAAGCADPETGAETGWGRLTIEPVADTFVQTRSETVPSEDDFALTVTGPDYERSWTTVAEFRGEDPLLPAGEYEAAVSYGDPEAEGPGKTHYAGSAAFRITPRKTTRVAVKATVANSQAVVRATEQFLRYFHDARFTLETASGNRFDFVPETALDGIPVSVKAATRLTVTGSARRQSPTGTDEGPEVVFGAQTIEAAAARTRHIFTFDAADAGSATLEITLGEGYTETRTLEIELNEASKPDQR